MAGNLAGNQDPQPDDLAELADLLRAQRGRATPLELDRIKLRARRQAARPIDLLSKSKGGVMKLRRHVVTGLVVLGLIGSGGGATFALAHGGGSGRDDDHGSSGEHQYKPGKGCGDKNHQHERRGECKHDDHGDHGGGGD